MDDIDHGIDNSENKSLLLEYFHDVRLHLDSNTTQ